MESKDERTDIMSKNRRIFSTVLSVILLVCVLALSGAAKEFTDMENHWSKTFVDYGVENGYINGYDDGTFRPDKTVTRAEFSKMINTALGIESKSEAEFSDVSKNDWFYNEVLKAVYAGYVSGYENGTFRPNNTITRQEAAVILYRVTLPAQGTANLSMFADGKDVADWASDAVGAMAAKGYISGDEYKRVLPNGGLTRGAAAKLIYQVLENENIYSGDISVAKNSSKFSETIIVGDVVADEDDAEIVLDNCRIFGKLVINADGVTVELRGTAVSSIENNAVGGCEITADDASQVKNGVVMNEQGTLSGDVFGNVHLKGEDLASGTVELIGDFGTVTADVSCIIRANGNVNALNITDGINLIVQKGNIESLTVEKNAENAVITLSSGVTVENAQVNAACIFMGKGVIKAAHNAVTGVRYETIPEELSGKGITDSEGNAVGKMDAPTITPANAKTGISRNTTITVQFDKAVYNKNGDALNESYIKSNIRLRKDSASGTTISCDVTVSSNRRITLDPASTLDASTKYYVVITDGAFIDADGNVNEALQSYFETDKDSVTTTGSVTITPENGETGVGVDEKIKVVFSEAMYRPNNKSALTEAYIKSNAIELREGSSSGATVDYSATISSNRTITITPESPLSPATRYYIIILSGSMVNKDGDAVSKKTSYFTTENTLIPTITPENAATNVSSQTDITIEFDTAVTNMSGNAVTSSYIIGNVVELRKGSKGGTEVDFTARISSDKKTITITPDEELAKNTKYYVIVNDSTLKNSKGAVNENVTVYFTTAAAMAPTVTPANANSNVSTGTDITVSFGETLYTTASSSTRVKVTASYIEEKEAVLLRKNTASGAIVDCDIEVSSGGVITLTPKEALLEDTRYYVVIKSKMFYNESGKYNSALNSYFNTSDAIAVEFTPADEETDVEVDSNIKVYFEENVYQANGSELTATYVANNVFELLEGDEDGEPVSFAVTFSSDKRTITLNPYEDLEGDTTYTIVLVAGSLVNDDDVENGKVVSTFTTEASADTKIVSTPEDKATGVSVSTSIEVKFASKIYRQGGGDVTKAFAKENIQLKKGSSSGTDVEAELTISSDGKTFTFVPEEALAVNTTYYVKILSGKFQYADDTKVAAKTLQFKTGSGDPVLSKFENDTVGATSAVFVATSDTTGTLYITATPKNGDPVEKSVPVTKDITKTFTLTGLEPDTDYTIKAYVKSSSAAVSATKTVTVATTSAFDAEVAKVTDSTVTLDVSAYSAGKLTVVYKNVATEEESTPFKNNVFAAGQSKEIVIKDLAPETDYEITATFVCDGTGEEPITVTETVTTEKAIDFLAISRILISDADGEIYEAEIGELVANAIVPETKSVRISVSANANTVVKVNGKSISAGDYSEVINVTSGEDLVVPIVLTHGGQNAVYDLTIKFS